MQQAVSSIQCSGRKKRRKGKSRDEWVLDAEWGLEYTGTRIDLREAEFWKGYA
jgi:hypothetical protein